MTLLLICVVLATTSAQHLPTNGYGGEVTFLGHPSELVLHAGLKNAVLKLKQDDPGSRHRPGISYHQVFGSHQVYPLSSILQQTSVGLLGPFTGPKSASNKDKHDSNALQPLGHKPLEEHDFQQGSSGLPITVTVQQGSSTFQKELSGSQQKDNNCHQGSDGLTQPFTNSQRGPDGFQQISSNFQQPFINSHQKTNVQQGPNDFQQPMSSSQLGHENVQSSSISQQERDKIQQGFKEAQQQFASSQKGSDNFQQSNTGSQQPFSGTQQGGDSFQQDPRSSQEPITRSQQYRDSFQQDSRSSQESITRFQQGRDLFRQDLRRSQEPITRSQQGQDSVQQDLNGLQEFKSSEKFYDSSQQGLRDQQHSGARQGPVDFQQVSRISQTAVTRSQDSLDGFQESFSDSQPKLVSTQEHSDGIEQGQTSGVTQSILDRNRQSLNGFQQGTVAFREGLGDIQQESSKITVSGSGFHYAGSSSKPQFRLSQQFNIKQDSTPFQSQTQLSQYQQGTRTRVVQGYLVSSDFPREGTHLLRSSDDLEQLNGILEPLNLSSGARLLLGDITSTFSCTDQPYGYYADQENSCRVFHVCYPAHFASGRIETYQYSFMCNDGSMFDQREMTCLQEGSAIPCHTSSQYYYRNTELGLPQEKQPPLFI
nr:uncharacterized protein LOC128699324 [Cherax quadricarinatus]